MARWLCTATDEDGDLKVAIVNDGGNSSMPFGDHSEIVTQMDVDQLDAIVELPADADFRPMVVDPVGDTEAAIIFIDL